MNIQSPLNKEVKSSFFTNFSNLIFNVFSFTNSESCRPAKRIEYELQSNKQNKIPREDYIVYDQVKKIMFNKKRVKIRTKESAFYNVLYQYNK
jgi:hypothetical protein